VVIDEMGGHYTDLPAKRDYILSVITNEEERFHRTLTNGLRILDELMDGRCAPRGSTVIAGQDAFHLWDTFGFPIDLTRDVAQDNRLHRGRSGLPHGSGRTAKEQSRATAVEKGRAGSSPSISLVLAEFQRLKETGVIDREGVRYRDLRKCGGNRDRRGRHLHCRPATPSAAHRRPGGDSAAGDGLSTPRAGGQMSDTGELYYWPEDLDAPGLDRDGDRHAPRASPA
jgi:hypothetical protein